MGQPLAEVVDDVVAEIPGFSCDIGRQRRRAPRVVGEQIVVQADVAAFGVGADETEVVPAALRVPFRVRLLERAPLNRKLG